MKFIKSYKIFESKDLDLEKHLKEYDIKDYSINEDGSIDVNQDVFMFKDDLNTILFKFNKINGAFDISYNNLRNLKNCPKYIEDLFICNHNKLISLEYGPEYVGSHYYCHNNKLITLKGCVEEVYGNFQCNDNKLTSLEFCPMQVDGDFDCSNNKLTELDRSPFIRKNLYCQEMFKSEPEFTGSCQNFFWKKIY